MTQIREYLETSLKEHKEIIAVLGGIVAIGFVGALAFSRYEGKSEQAREAYYLALKTFESEMKPLIEKAKTSLPEPKSEPKSKVASKDDAARQKAREEAQAMGLAITKVTFQKLDVDTAFPESVKRFKEVDEKFAKARAGYEARMKLGNLYYEHGEYAKALPWFEKAQTTAPNGFEKSIAYTAIGHVQENLGKPTAAVMSFQKAIDSGAGINKGDLLIAIARCYESAHDTAKANSTYDQIISDMPNSEQARYAEILKGKL